MANDLHANHRRSRLLPESESRRYLHAGECVAGTKIHGTFQIVYIVHVFSLDKSIKIEKAFASSPHVALPWIPAGKNMISAPTSHIDFI